jgi:hypothetical protein
MTPRAPQRRPGPAPLVAGLGLIFGLAWWASDAARWNEPVGPRLIEPATVGGPSVAVGLPAGPVPVAAPVSNVVPAPVPPLRVQPAASVQARVPWPESAPYRVLGRLVVDGEVALVFFGRGRTVTRVGPGPLDDEFVVEAIGDEQVLLRHLPTASARFIDLAVRAASSQALPLAPGLPPESFPAD